jgi:hypothetical protein
VRSFLAVLLQNRTQVMPLTPASVNPRWQELVMDSLECGGSLLTALCLRLLWQAKAQGLQVSRRPFPRLRLLAWLLLLALSVPSPWIILCRVYWAFLTDPYPIAVAFQSLEQVRAGMVADDRHLPRLLSSLD